MPETLSAAGSVRGVYRLNRIEDHMRHTHLLAAGAAATGAGAAVVFVVGIGAGIADVAGAAATGAVAGTGKISAEIV